jgi:hypothetical protein
MSVADALSGSVGDHATLAARGVARDNIVRPGAGGRREDRLDRA